ncbi:MAG: hypothetical protein IJ795_06525 [Bacteroidales bacterium]|nr:hypothetical protein [Bacteroidales bacterium]
MKKTFLILLSAAAIVLAGCNKTPEPAPSQDPSTSPSEEPGDQPGPVPPPIVTGKVILNGKTGFDTFSAAYEAAKVTGEDALLTISAGTLEENILIDGFPGTLLVQGQTGAVLDGSIEIARSAVAIRNLTVFPDKKQAEGPEIEIHDRNNFPFAIFVHDAMYGFSMDGVTVNVSKMSELTTAVVLRGETIGQKEELDNISGCTFIGSGQRLMQIYDGQVQLLGNAFSDFYSGYAIRIGEDIGDEAFYDNESGPTVVLSGNSFASASDAAVNFYIVYTSDITFGDGVEDDNVKGDGLKFLYTCNQKPGGDAVWAPQMTFDPATKELYPTGSREEPQPEGILTRVWAHYESDGWEAGISDVLNWDRNAVMDDSYVYIPVAGQNTEDYGLVVLDVKTGELVKKIEGSVFPQADGRFATCGIALLRDGNILVSNMALSGTTLKVWKLSSIDATPELILTYDTKGRYGDVMTAYGTMENGVIFFVNYNRGAEEPLLEFPIKDGSVQDVAFSAYFVVNEDISNLHMCGIYPYGFEGIWSESNNMEIVYAGNAPGRTYARWGYGNGWYQYYDLWETDRLSNAKHIGIPLGNNMIDPRWIDVYGQEYMCWVSFTSADPVKGYLRLMPLPSQPVDDFVATVLAGKLMAIGETAADFEAVSEYYPLVSATDLEAASGKSSNGTGFCYARVIDDETYILAGLTHGGISMFKVN